MSGDFQKKTSSILVTALIGVIIISFMFTGYESMQGAPDSIGKVGDYPISFREYQAEMERQMQMYANYMYGGKPLSAQQIKEMRIKEATLQRLVQQKLFISLADDMSIVASVDDVKNEIKSFPVFKQEKGDFDVTRYKAVLAANRLTPADFELEIESKVKAERLQELIKIVPTSKKYISDLASIKRQQLAAEVISLNRANLEKYIPVDDKEIDAFIAKPDALKRAQDLFQSRKSDQYDRPEQVKASHILIKEETEEKSMQVAQELRKSLNSKNFSAMADKHSKDPGNKDPKGKTKGGTLGWFSKGRMVPEFEKVAFDMKIGDISEPFKSSFGVHIMLLEEKQDKKEAIFEDLKKTLAKELIQRENKAGLDSLIAKLKKEVQETLNAGDSKKIAQLVATYQIEHQPEAKINRLDGLTGRINISTDQVTGMFAENLKSPKVFVFDDVLATILVRARPLSEKEVTELKIDEEQLTRSNELNMARTLSEQLIKDLEQRVKVKVRNELL
jgi:peptidyl-prolyl cis-trans isomerase D